MHIEGKLCILELFNAVVLVLKVLFDGSGRVVGDIEDGFDFDDIGSLKCGKATL